MPTRRRYGPRKYRDGGAVPPSDVTDVHPPETIATPPPVEPRSELPPSDAADHDAVKRAAEAVRRAEELQQELRRNPQAIIDAHIDGMPNLSAHKKAFLKANPLLLNSEIMPLAGRAWQQALASGVADDTPEMNQKILQAVRHGIEAQRHQANPAMAALPTMPMPVPSDEVERLEAEADSHLAALRAAPPLPPIATPRRSLPVSAPVSRDVPTASEGKVSQQTQVTLNAEERDIAHKSYAWMRKADAEREYAMQKSKLLRMGNAEKESKTREWI